MSRYGVAAGEYWRAGWRGLLPLPPGRKAPVPEGWTGHVDVDPSWPDVQAWADTSADDANIALRLPADVIGIDVDDYADKGGAATLAELRGRFGPLPGTVMSTSRDNGSGIRLYRVPPGLHWPGGLGDGIEVIQRTHRYLVVAPSIHPEGGTYRWLASDTNTAAPWPRPHELPDLPAAWVEGITRGELATEHARADLDDAQARDWLIERTATDPKQAPCRAVAAVLVDGILKLDTTTQARHDTAVNTTQALMHLLAEGHDGVSVAVRSFRDAWHQALARDPGRGADSAGEWRRMLTGAIRVAAAAHGGASPAGDPCLSPFPGIVEAAPSGGPVPATPPWESGPARLGHTMPAGSPTSTTGAAATTPAAPVDWQVDALAILADQEANRLRARRAAVRRVDAEEHLATFRVPPFVADLTAELALPDELTGYRVEAVLPANSNAVLTAGFKAGKTTLINHLAAMYVDGGHFLSEHLVHGTGRRVALFNYEVDRSMYRGWLRDAGIVNTDQVVVLNLRGYRMPVTVPAVEDWLVDWLGERDVGMWVVDPFARAFAGGEENSNSEVGAFLDALDVIKARAGVDELVLPVHTGRAEHAEGRERARGATRLDDWTDVRWLLTRDDDGHRYFRATGRDVEVAEVRLGFHQAERRPFVIGGSRRVDKAQAFDSAIAENLDRVPGMSLNALRKAMRADLGAVDNIYLAGRIEQLEQRGMVKVDRTGTVTRHWWIETPAPFGGIVAAPDTPPDDPNEQGVLDV